MNISDRIRKIREFRGLKQEAVAQEMNISQQSYSWMERKSANIKIETLKRFCDALKVDLPFLMASDIPMTEENLKMFDTSNYALVFEDYKKLKTKASTYEDLLFKKQNH